MFFSLNNIFNAERVFRRLITLKGVWPPITPAVTTRGFLDELVYESKPKSIDLESSVNNENVIDGGNSHSSLETSVR